MRYKSLLVSLAILIAVAGNVQVIRGDSVGSSSQSSGTLVPPLNVTFRAKIDGSIAKGSDDLRSFILFDDKLCFNGEHSHALYDMDLNTGKIVWSYEAPAYIDCLGNGFQQYQNLMIMTQDYTTSPPTGVGTWAAGSGAVIAVNVDTKTEVWNFPTKHMPFDLHVVNGMLYFRSNEEGIYALNASTGKVRWLYPELPDNRSSTGKKGFIDLLLTQDVIYTSSSGVLVALDSDSGREKFRFNVGNATVSAEMDDLVLSNNILYGDLMESRLNSNVLNTSFVAFDPSTRRFFWKTPLYTDVTGGYLRPIVTNDSIYVTGISFGGWSVTENQSRIYALDASSGRVRWSSERGDFYSNMVLDKPYLYALDIEYLHDETNSFLGRINAYDTRSGVKVWNYSINKAGGYSLVRAGLLSGKGTGIETIYLTDAEGGYFVYGFSSSSAEAVPELPNTSMILTVSILALIPLLFRKRGRCEYA